MKWCPAKAFAGIQSSCWGGGGAARWCGGQRKESQSYQVGEIGRDRGGADRRGALEGVTLVLLVGWDQATGALFLVGTGRLLVLVAQGHSKCGIVAVPPARSPTVDGF